MKKITIPFMLLLGLAACGPGDPPIANITTATIDTFAGNVKADGYGGDSGPAKLAGLGWVTDVAVDDAGNVLISDGGANTVRRVDASGIIKTIAGKFEGFNRSGSNVVFYAGDGGPATEANLNVPFSICARSTTGVWIADAGNNAIRHVAINGNIETVAGNGQQGYSGDNGLAANARLYNPYRLASDDVGNIYIADKQNHVIRKIDTQLRITTIAGLGPDHAGYTGDGGPATEARLSEPMGIAVDHSGNIYISDQNNVIRMISSATGKISTIAGKSVAGFSGDGGPATEALLSSPRGIAVMTDGSIVFSDSGNNRIRKIRPENNIIETIAGTGEAGYSGDGGPATSAKLTTPEGIAVDKDDNIYVAESGSAVIRIIKPAF